MSADIAAFLAERYDEAQALAEAATPGPWEFEGDDPTDDELISVHDGAHGDLVGDVVAYTRGVGRQVANGRFMEHWNPQRALADIALKRAILKLYADTAHIKAECERKLGRGELLDEFWSRDYMDARRELCVLEAVVRHLGTEFTKHPACNAPPLPVRERM